MQSFIIVSSPDEAQAYLSAFYKENKIDVFDRMVVEPTEASFGIAQVRKIQEVLYLKPSRGKAKTVVIEKADSASKEAQNALLKILEEPPAATFIFLLANTIDSFLPTVLSRCTVVKLKDSDLHLKGDKLDIDLLEAIREGSVSYKLKVAADIGKEKQEALSFLESMILSLRMSLVNGKGDLSIVKKAQQAHTTIRTTNVNVRLALETLFLSF